MAKSYMEYSRNFFWNLKKYGLALSQNEIRESIITITMIGFVLSFREWGGATFNFLVGIQNFFIATVLAAIAFAFWQFGQRWVAVYYGYNPEFKISMIGLMLSLVIAFASRGYLIFFMPGYIIIHMLAASRLGEFRYYTNMWEWSKVCAAGPFLNLAMVIILSLTPHKEIVILNKAMMINFWFAIFSMIPMPYNPGMYIFFSFRYFWAFCFAAILIGGILAIYTNALIAILGGLLLGTIVMAWYFLKVDAKLG